MYTYSFNLRVHRVPLHSECVGQLYRLFFRSCFCLWLPLVVDGSFPPAIQLCTFWSSNTGSQAVKQCTPCCKFLEWATWLRNEWDWSVIDSEVNLVLESCVYVPTVLQARTLSQWLLTDPYWLGSFCPWAICIGPTFDISRHARHYTGTYRFVAFN